MQHKETDFLNEIFAHLMEISKGGFSITEERMVSEEVDIKRQILYGLKFLHEDRELFREEQKAQFESNKRTEILKAKNDELEQFVNIASHDLQEPLRTVSMMIQMLEKIYGDKLDSEGKEMIGLAKSGMARMRSQIKGLVEYSVIGRTRNVEQVNTAQLVKFCIEDLELDANFAKSEIIVSPLPTIKGFHVELRGLFYQLLSNALKFVNRGVIPRIVISAEERAHEWKFSISDNGIGLDSRYSDKVFGMFERLHGKNVYPGLGVGLALAKKIIDSHAGKIWYESNESGGTTFFFTVNKHLT